MTTINLLTQEEAVQAVDWYGPLLQTAIARSEGRWTYEQALYDIGRGVLAVFVATEGDKLVGVFTARILESPERRWLLVEDFAGENIEAWLPQADRAITHLARRLDCSQITTEGRKGWSRKLKNLGWRTDIVVSVKEVTP